MVSFWHYFPYKLSLGHLFGILNAQEQKFPTEIRILVHATSKLTGVHKIRYPNGYNRFFLVHE